MKIEIQIASLVKLLAMDMAHHLTHKRLHDAGVEIDGLDTSPILDVCLDVLGMPESEHTKLRYEDPAYFNAFCRDWWQDKWAEICDTGKNSKIEPFLIRCRRDAKKIKDEGKR